jgi:TIR domain
VRRGRDTSASATSDETHGRVFISYRREDTAYPAGWLFDRLVERLGPDQVFKDVDSIELGDDFVRVITDAVAATDVLLALIGQEWVSAADEHGGRRLDDPDDFVRLEIEAALARRVRVIPILVDGATMPRREEMPPSLAPLSRRQALELSATQFTFDTSRLLRAIEKTLVDVRTAQTEPASPERSTPTRRQRVPPDALPPPPKQAASEDGAGPPPTAHRWASPRWPKPTRRLLLVGAAAIAAVAAIIVAVAVVRSDDPSPAADTASFSDDFSSNAGRWTSDPAGGRVEGGAYRISSTRSDEYWAVMASPGAGTEIPSDLDLKVDARRTGGSATTGFGYGLFCRADGPDNLYAFVIWRLHAKIEKRTDGNYTYLARDPTIQAQAPVDPQARTLEATCVDRGDGAVELSFWVDGKLVERSTDTEDPHTDGSAGVMSMLNRTAGDPDDTLEVEFDNFAGGAT